MSNNNINLNINLDDSDVKKGLVDIGAGLDKVNNEAKQVEKSVNKAFDTKPIDDAEKAVKDVNKELADTDKQLKKTSSQGKKTGKTLNASFRSAGRNISRFRRGLSGLFRATGIGFFLATLGSLISGLGDFKNTILDALGPVGDFFRDAIDAGRDFLSTITFGIVDSTATISKALQDNIKKVVEATELLAIQEKSILLERVKVQAEIEGRGAEEILAIQKKAGDARIEGLKKQLEQAEKEAISFLSAAAIAEIDADNESNKRRKLELQEIAANERKKQAEAEKRAEQLKLSIAKANLELLNIEKDFNADIEAERKAAAEKAKAAADKAAADAAQAARKEQERLKKELELKLLFLLDEELAQEERIRNRAKAREEEAKKIVKDAELLNQILLGIAEKRDKELQELKDKREKAQQDEAAKQRQDQFKAAQEGLRIQQEGDKARLRESEANQRLAFQSVERTENDIAQFEAQIQKDREEQSLRFEKERLQLLLKFGDLRTDAEKDNIQKLIDAIDAEINVLKGKADEAAEDQPEQGFLARLLGLTNKELEAVQKAVNIAIDNVNKLLDTRINALDEEINAREKNLDRLSNILSAEQALLEAGEAANVRSTLDQIEQEEKAREKALKKQKQALVAKQAIDAVTQTSSLITASAQIFQSLSPIPIVGIPLAISTIALMFGSFAAAQAQAFSSINTQKLNTGGRIMNGEKDTNGGKGNRIEGTNLVVGRGEWVINADASEEHNDFLEAINRGDYDGVNLNKLMSKRTVKSIKTTENKAKKAYNKKVQQNKNRAIERALSKQTNVLHSDLVGIHNKPSIAATEDGYIIRHDLQNGNSIIKKVKTK